MERSSDFIQEIIKSIEASDFNNATISITGIDDENDERYDDVLGYLVKLFSREVVPKEKTAEVIKQISLIYDQNNDNSEQLKKKLDNLLSSFGLIAGKISEDQELVGISSWTEMQLKEKIKELQQEQQDLLNSGKSLNPKIGQQLNKLLEEHSKRLGYKGKNINDSQVNEEQQQSKEKPAGADSWFVVPSKQELEKKIKTHVVCGSPIIKILQSRYKIQYKVKKIIDVNLDDLANLSADEAYEMKRELNKQKDFVSNYSDPTLIVDQDICAYEIASEFLTDKYTEPELVRIDEGLSCYVFKSGYLKDSFNTNTAQHTFSVEGNVIDRFAICLNRKEPDSGRFINDSYDIIEFQDGQPCLYFYSSKGASALSGKMIESIKLAGKNTSFDLTTPEPSAIGKPMTKEDLEAFIVNCRKGKSASLPQNEITNANKVVEQSEADIEKEKNLNLKTVKKNDTEKIDNEETKALDTNPKAVDLKEATSVPTEQNSNPTPVTEAKSDETVENLDQVGEQDSVVVNTDVSELNETKKELDDMSTQIEEENKTPNIAQSGDEKLDTKEDDKNKPVEKHVKEEGDANPLDNINQNTKEIDETITNTIDEQNETIKDVPPVAVDTSGESKLEEEPHNVDTELEDENKETEAIQENSETVESEQDSNKEDKNIETQLDSQSIEKTDDVSEHIEKEDLNSSKEEKSNGISETKKDDVEDDSKSESEADGEKENESQDSQGGKFKSRIDRLEKIAVNSLESLDKMEKKISKLDEFIDVVQENISSGDISENNKSKNSAQEEKHILKKRATAIKKSIKKKNNKNE